MTQKNRQPQLFTGDAEFDGDVQMDGDITNTGAITNSGVVTYSGSVQAALIAGGTPTLAITNALHGGRTIAMDDAAGIAITLPAATGTGAKFRFVVAVAYAAADYSIACAGTDEFGGTLLQSRTDDDSIATYPALAADNFDVITFGAITQGGVVGDYIEVEDVVAGVWAVMGHITGTGVVATPFTTT